MENKEKPILFSTKMVQALLNGTKRQTRRIMKPQLNDTGYLSRDGNFEYNEGTIVKAKYNIGDTLWVRETFIPPLGYGTIPCYIYKANNEHNELFNGRWKPSIFMPKKACRIYLEITDVKIEKLQDISKEDAIAEGIEVVVPNNEIKNVTCYKDYEAKNNLKSDFFCNPINSYQTLWNSINGKHAWLINPYVWVYKFKIIER